MLFTLEAVKAKRGDALLLHFGDPDRPRLILIDGGWLGVFREFLQPRLDRLKTRRSPRDPMALDLVMVSHIDSDHIAGILDLTDALRKRRELREPEPYRVRRLWHNSFDDVVGNHSDELFRQGEEAVGVADLGGFDVPPELLDQHPGAAVVASVPQGRKLRLDAERLGIPVNRFEGQLVLASDEPVPFRDGLSLRVLAPREERVRELQEEWDKILREEELDREPDTTVAEFADKSVFNLSSIVVLAEMEGKRMLLTGDARGDDVLAAVEAAGLFDDDDKLRLDVLKLPHHGSERNVEDVFFERLPASHYVISADGFHHNPDLETIEMILRAVRKRAEAGEIDEDAPVHLHMTYAVDELHESYPADELQELLDEAEEEGLPLEVRFPRIGDLSLRVDLLEPLRD